MAALGILMYKGDGITKDTKNATLLLQRAASMGSKEAQDFLATQTNEAENK
jgi:TPR repeat protein